LQRQLELLASEQWWNRFVRGWLRCRSDCWLSGSLSYIGRIEHVSGAIQSASLSS
jgi:hypothetical protein